MGLVLDPQSPWEERRKILERFALVGALFLFLGGLILKYRFFLGLFLLGVGMGMMGLPFWLSLWILLLERDYLPSEILKSSCLFLFFFLFFGGFCFHSSSWSFLLGVFFGVTGEAALLLLWQKRLT